MRTAFWLLGFLLLSGRAAAAPSYSVIDLGPVASEEGKVFLNDLGQAAFNGPGGIMRYTDGLGGALIAQGGVGGINNAGQVSLVTAIGADTVIARFTEGRGIEAMAEVNGLPHLTGPNSRGDIAFGDESGAYYVSDAGVELIGNLTWPYTDFAFASDINNAGMVVHGYVSIFGDDQCGVYTHPAGRLDHRPLSHVTALNNRGDLLGYADDHVASVRWTNRTVAPLGDLYGNRTVGVELNDEGTIIGYGWNGTIQTPWVSSPDGPVDLNALIDPAQGWRLTLASSINARGQIAGVGARNGAPHAYRIDPVNPVPEPGSLTLLGAAVLVPLARRRRGTAPSGGRG